MYGQDGYIQKIWTFSFSTLTLKLTLAPVVRLWRNDPVTVFIHVN
jgi:hypothetical protein